jgi:hypothetical protein
MADKSNFTKEEWALLLQSPMIAGMAITAADPSGLWGLLRIVRRWERSHPSHNWLTNERSSKIGGHRFLA